jgi:hypothetical protein
MKKLIALLLSLIMVFAFVSCDFGGDDDDDDGGSKKTLTVDDVMENLENAGYFLELIEDEKTLNLTHICDGFYPEGALTAIVEAANFETDEFVRVYFFELSSDAKELNDLFEEYEAGGENTGAYKNQGKLFIRADTEQGIADALGNKNRSGNGGSSIGGIGGIGDIGGGSGSAEEGSSKTGIGGLGGIGGIGGIGGGNTDSVLTLEQMMANLEKAGFTCEIETSEGEEYVKRALSGVVDTDTFKMITIGECSSASDAKSEYENMMREGAGVTDFFTIELYDRYIFVTTNEEYIEIAKGNSSESVGGGSSNSGSIGGVTQNAFLDRAYTNLTSAGYDVETAGSPEEGGRTLSAVSSSTGETLVIIEYVSSSDALAYYNEARTSSLSSAFPCIEMPDEYTVVLATTSNIMSVAYGN